MARQIAAADRDAVLEAVREACRTDRYVRVELEGGAALRVSTFTGTQIAVMPDGVSSYTRTRSGRSRETCGVFFRVTTAGEIADADQIASHVDVVIRRAYAAVASYELAGV